MWLRATKNVFFVCVCVQERRENGQINAELESGFKKKQ